MNSPFAKAAIFHKSREVIKLMNVHLNHFPRHEKYALCQEIRRAAYEVYNLLVECQKRYHNKTTLSRLASSFCRRIRSERHDLIPQLPHYRSAS